MEHVGVGSFHLHMSRPNEWLKRYALLFDRFYISDLRACFAQQKYSGYGRASTVRDLEWLIEQGLIQEAPFVTQDAKDLTGEEADVIAAARRALDQHYQDMQSVQHRYDQEQQAELGWEYSAVPDNLAPLIDEVMRRGYDVSSLVAHQVALNMRATRRANAICLEAKPTVFAGGLDRAVTRNELCTLVIESLCVPDQSVSWQDVIQFRDDPVSKAQLRDLRLWMEDTVRGGWTAGEAADRLAALRDEQARHVQGSGFKGAAGVLEAVVVGTAEILEDLAKFRWKALAEMPFKAVRSGLDAGRSSQGGPGHQLSYLARAEDHLGRRS